MFSKVIGIDPGLTGGWVSLKEVGFVCGSLPIKDKDIDFDAFVKLLSHTELKESHIFLERAVSFGMGTKGAFNYGRCFAAIEIAIHIVGLPVTYVEPKKWTKVMHEGIDSNIKPKAKSLIAVQRLYPMHCKEIPKSKTGKLHEGIVDALLIAGYGRRQAK